MTSSRAAALLSPRSPRSLLSLLLALSCLNSASCRLLVPASPAPSASPFSVSAASGLSPPLGFVSVAAPRGGSSAAQPVYAHCVDPLQRCGARPRAPASAAAPSSFAPLTFAASPLKGRDAEPPTTGCWAYKLTFGGNEAGEKEGRVALVTGASRGIGKAIAETLAEAGVSHLLCVARQQAACDEAAAELQKRGFSASGHAVDVADGQAVGALCEDLLKQFPHIDILVNNAGITRDNLFIRMGEQEWNDVINTNLNSAFYFSSHLIKRMVKNRFGRIINIASVIGVGGNPGQANYAASKAGLIGLTRTLGKEYANRGITVNAIAPGFIRSAMTDKMPEDAKKQAMERIPAGRLGEPKDVAALAAFLASDQAGYITAKVIPVDGGMLFGGN
ncbi:3-ketoacyl-(acyl-carrier-protein) reductase [Besnoitia besnoiti]|uniref:3-oxoacyl-[acyl-carrier-protein] reductase n=1 Tax=Besnoitia besnoiti TaxID=94643 RepID=A0A2A9MQM3_BESBE|nr:3-ketoacyl-(acyl-carrier-protein) reductase [Besnoitia besnoiti]PFH38380.1 3-ketoacyl-(acyl-carrier-protein) reductase [Besnoitia besnoiti]